MKSVQIPKPVTSIGDEAFAYCDELKSIKIPDSVEFIGFGAFTGCTFPSIKIPKSVVSFGGNPFGRCNFVPYNRRWVIEEIDISENPNLDFSEGVLINRGMSRIVFCDYYKSGDYSIPNTVTAICAGGFWRCRNLTSIVIPD